MPTEPPASLSQLPPEEAIRRISKARELLLAEIHKVVIGQADVLEQILIGLFAQGHCLAIGVPGLAKSLAVATLAKALQLRFHRIQLTPDMTPADLVGQELWEEDPSSHQRMHRFIPGPLFANIILADEIQAAPPKAQAALLDAMATHQVTVGETQHLLDAPFFVLATHNPVEMEGIHPLLEAQLDRFMLSIQMGYPTREEERQMVAASTGTDEPEIRPLLRPRDIGWIQQWVRQIPVSEVLVDYAVDLTRATRPTEKDAPEFSRQWLAWGAGPRAAQNLILAAKARALLKGRYAVHAADVRWVARPVLRHRLSTNAAARMAGVTVDHVLDRVLQTVREGTGAGRPLTPPILEVAGGPSGVPGGGVPGSGGVGGLAAGRPLESQLPPQAVPPAHARRTEP